NIINALQSLDKTYSNSELVRKILRCLPRSWMPKVTAIEEAKNLNLLPLEDLLGSLMTHELTMQKREDDEEKEKKKKNMVALKSSANEDSDDDEDLALFTRKENRAKKEEVICFECNKPGHYKSDCPTKKKEFMKKKKAMVATWDDNDESSSDEDTREQVVQLALMAFKEEEEEENDEVTYDELVIICEKYSSMIASLKKKVKILSNENNELKSIDLSRKDNSKEVEIDFLQNEVGHLEEENKNLKVEIEALKKTFSKFSNSSEKLENLLRMQRCVFDKAGLGYEEMTN
ncbi:LOW QUALITY PROTEIN: zf-CCHC domain-containing protein/UBN2 domain-containing protein, partial [Cephalotus follicularis]